MKDINIIKFDSLASTNDYLKELARSGAKEKTVVIANRQTAGKGTKKRSFISPEGGLYMSVLLRPEMVGFDATRITCMTAVAVSECIDRFSGHKSQIKWVNDVYIQNKKACGILCEAELSPDGEIPFVVVGIGINLTPPKGGFAKEIVDIATAVFDKCEEHLKDLFTNNLISTFFDYYNTISENTFLASYRKKNLVLGRNVTVCEYDKFYLAKALEIDDECRLVVQKEDGTQKTLSSAEVSLKI